MLSIVSQFAQVVSDDVQNGMLISPNPNTTSDTASAGILAGAFLVWLLVFLMVYLLMAFSLYKMFKKAGREDAWAGFVPIYQNWVLYETAGRPGWWALLYLVPFVGWVIGLIVAIIAYIDVAKSFGKGTGYALLLIFLPIIGFPMLGFGSATYHGPAGPDGAHQPQPPVAPTPPTQQVPPTPPQPPVVQ